ncbi:haloacid dehalogenase [Catellatospora sp. TT07R-123]|uniref:HAD-IA family hydrolase n=1 Tax=Catellatospora sp. TT07R-123 TaxID=2733863 RepID=UPI001B0CAD86|nr:HAD-IA family hydrolase [Catellatospora sp. TT07R-123]GHJ49830.1 haloacid dehalogenase [Catellatospora sp. TT07R-123]
MRRRPAEALLIDFDGVLRQYDPDAYPGFEQRHGVAPSALLDSGLTWGRLLPAITGYWTRQQWLDEIAADTGASAEAVAEWDAYRGRIDGPVLEFVRAARAAGRKVALVTNATDDLRQDLARFGLEAEFDAVISSAELRTHKPTKEFFAAACQAVQTPPDRCLLVDDTDRHIRGARVAGLSAMRWSGPADLPYLRAALSL